MKIFRFAVNLRLWHPTLDPETITTEMGISPNIQRRVVSSFADTTSVPDSGWETYWASGHRSGEDLQLLDVLAGYAEELKEHAPFIASLRSTGGRAELFVGWFASTRAGGPVIGHDLLRRFGELQVDLSLDVYGTGEQPDDPE